MVLLVGILVLGLLMVSGPASAEPSTAPVGRPLYLALGDSLAAGVGASDPEVTAYVPQVYQLLRQELACQPPGRSSASIGCRLARHEHPTHSAPWTSHCTCSPRPCWW